MILFISQSTPGLLCEKSWEELYHIAPVVVKGLGLRFELMALLSSTSTLAHHHHIIPLKYRDIVCLIAK